MQVERVLRARFQRLDTFRMLLTGRFPGGEQLEYPRVQLWDASPRTEPVNEGGKEFQPRGGGERGKAGRSTPSGLIVWLPSKPRVSRVTAVTTLHPWLLI